MLILSRKAGEVIYLGDDIRVKVTEIDYERGRVKIGIEAPESIRILREEIYREIQEQQKLEADGFTS